MTALVLILALGSSQDVDAKKAISTFKKAYRTRDASKRVAAVSELAKTDHARVHSTLSKLLTGDVKEVRIAAAEGLAGTTENRKKVVQYLANAIGPNYKEPDAAAACVKALEKLQEGMGVAIVRQLFRSPDIRVETVAVQAAERVRKRAFIPALINFLNVLETQARAAGGVGPSGNRVVGGIPGVTTNGGVVDPNAPLRAKKVIPIVHKALETLTGQKWKTVREWAEWWKQSEVQFEIPRK